MIKYHCGVLAAVCAAVFSSFAGSSADIQALIDAADPGATVTIPSGTYLLETPVLVNKAITLAGDSADRTLVILDGQAAVNCVELSEGATLRDLTVQNGAGGKTVGSVICGAGVYAIGATIDNCIIRGCALDNEDTKFVTRGAGVYLNGGMVQGCLFTGNVNTGCGSSAGNTFDSQGLAGGGIYAVGAATVQDCRFTDNRLVNNKKGSRADNGSGAAACIGGASALIDNCLFESNSSSNGGGAVCAGNGAMVRNSTFDGNTFGAEKYAYGGQVAAFGAKVIGCVFTNIDTSTIQDDNGYGSIVLAVGGAEVTSCLFENNTYYRGGAIGCPSGQFTASNCVFKANRSTDRGGVISLYSGSATVVDSWFVENDAGSYGSVVFARTGCAVALRNCWFLRNKKAGGYAVALYNSSANSATIENCSFVDNACGVVADWDNGQSVAKIKVSNTLVFETTGNYHPFGAHADFATNGNIAFVASDDMTNLDLSDASGNVDLGETNPKNIFRDYYSDPANYALAPVSPAKDAGTAVVPDWVGEGTLDMGTGEYEVKDVADYGVKIDRVGAKPRVVNGRIDIGAAEYEYEQGDEDWNKEPTEPYTPGETLPVFENGSDRIAAAIEQTASGERVAVPKGVYRMSGAVELARTDITGFRSLANHPGAVVLDFQGQSAGIYSAEPIEVRGVTVENAVGGVEVSVVDFDGSTSVAAVRTTRAGAGICLTSAMSLITNCVVRNCSVVSDTTAVHGAGIFSAGKVVNATVSGCSIEAKKENAVAHGGGIFLTQGASGVNLTVADCEVRATIADVNARGTAGGGALGLCQATVEGGVFSGSVVTNIHTAGRIEGYGGGVTLYGGELRNCLVSNNWTHAGGGGVWARSDALVENCTICDNQLKVYPTSKNATEDKKYASGAGLGLINSAAARGCRIARNTSDHSCDRAGASGAVALGTTTKMSDCVIEENSGAGSVIAGVHTSHQMSSVLLSNCVIRANTYGKVNRGSLFSPLFAANGTLTVVDSFICGNKGENSSNPSVLLMTLGVGTTGTTVFRNSLIADNSHSSNCPLVHYYNTASAVKFENCTVVGNKMNVVENTTAEWGTYFTSANTVFYGNTNGTAKAGFSANAVAQVTTTAVDNPANLTFDETTGNIDLSATDPKFTDPANGVYALKSSSPLRDKGVAGDWAKVEGCTDLGDGTYTIAAALDWGVTVTGNNKHPRTGVKKAVGVIDIGACEYYNAPGLMLILR